MNYEKLYIDNQLYFALYASSKAVIKSYKPLLDDLGITYTQYITLLVLWREDNITVKELGKKLYWDSGTLTPVLKRLESLNVIQRIRDS
ncbi:MarR family transcriptional regulator [Clostridium sp.]|uniref:MarR family winged helix-turn-helix transcriptional regulator n=1 Tax=Clostridium sp. TaxID=1506 RepID=UPI00321790E0